jgi:tetratricopeptide (TPR) repeat protein
VSDYNELKREAESLRKANNHQMALTAYEKLLNLYENQCNEWEHWGYAHSLYKLKRYKEALSALRNAYVKFQNSPKIRNLYAWSIYQTEINKKIDNEEIYIKAAKAIFKLAKQSDEYSPYTITVLKLLDHFKQKPNYPSETILQLTELLSPNELSTKTLSYTDEKGKTIEFASHKEQWYMYRTKALYENERYAECIDVCQEILKQLKILHYANEIWFKRRIALSNAALGDIEKALKILIELLSKKKEWFIELEIAQLYNDRGDKKAALKYAVDAALNVGDIDKKIGAYQLLFELLEKNNKIGEAKTHLEFIFAIKREFGYKIDQELNALCEKYNIDETKKAKQLKAKLEIIWAELKFEGKEMNYGIIDAILENGKAGFVKDEGGNSFYFLLRDFKNGLKLAVKNAAVTFYVVDGFNKKKNRSTKNAVNVRLYTQNVVQ